MAYCRKCGGELSPDANFCKECGEKKTSAQGDPALCPECGTTSSVGAKFCKKCGYPLKSVDVVIDVPSEAEVFISDPSSEEIQSRVKGAVRIFTSEAPSTIGETVLADWASDKTVK